MPYMSLIEHNKKTERISLKSPICLEKTKHIEQERSKETKKKQKWHLECGLLLQQMLSSFLLLSPSLSSLQLSPSLDASPQVIVIMCIVLCYIAFVRSC